MGMDGRRKEEYMFFLFKKVMRSDVRVNGSEFNLSTGYNDHSSLVKGRQEVL